MSANLVLYCHCGSKFTEDQPLTNLQIQMCFYSPSVSIFLSQMIFLFLFPIPIFIFSNERGCFPMSRLITADEACGVNVTLGGNHCFNKLF